VRERVLDYEEAVLDIVSLIPAGKVLTYGDIADILEKGGPRQVGAVMSRGSAGVPWWRVLRADGRPPQGLEAAAVEHYRRESTALRVAARNRRAGASGEYQVDLAASRWNPTSAEGSALQRVRAGLERCISGSPDCSSGLSEPDDEVGP
jgi:alkylated DNA nucleotide flippase Atl1